VTWINTECTLHQQCLDIYGEPRLYGNGETDETMPSPVKSMLTFSDFHYWLDNNIVQNYRYIIQAYTFGTEKCFTNHRNRNSFIPSFPRN
jgi:hypothetical protein